MSASAQQRDAAARRLSLMMAMRRDGVSIATIAERFGMRAASVSQMISKERAKQVADRKTEMPCNLPMPTPELGAEAK